MDYYDRVVHACELIDKEFAKGSTVSAVKYKVMTVFGLGPKIVDKRINLLKEVSEDV
jgi:hypothetical protein